jgi:hypothetical protein
MFKLVSTDLTWNYAIFQGIMVLNYNIITITILHYIYHCLVWRCKDCFRKFKFFKRLEIEFA